MADQRTRSKSLSQRAYDLQTHIAKIVIDREALLHPDRESGQFTESQARAVAAYRKSAEGLTLQALWELAGHVFTLAKAIEGANDGD